MRVTHSLCALALLAGSLVAISSARAGAEDAEVKGRITVLTRQLKSQVHTERVRAAKELGEMGRDAEAATSALCAALADRHGSVRQAASEALEEVNPEQDAIKIVAMRGLVKFGKAAKSAIDPLRRAKGNGSAQVRAAAEEALNAIEAAADKGSD